MDLGFNNIVKSGNGNTLIVTAVAAAALANLIPTPFDGIYFRRVNKLERDYEQKLITAKKLEWHVAGEYYLWTALWYGVVLAGFYALGGNYKTNVKVLGVVIAGGIVIGSVQKNIEIDEKVANEKV